MKEHATLRVGAALLASAICLSGTPTSAQTKGQAAQEDITKLSEDAYVYGYPLVLMEATKKHMLAGDGLKLNEFAHAGALATSNDRAVVRPNVDTLYSSAWLDLSAGPVVLHVPATERYYVMQMLDAWTNVFAAPGPRTTGKQAQDFAIVGPNYQGDIPAGMKRIDAPTNMVWILGRVQVNGPADLTRASKEQLQFSLRPVGAAKASPQKSSPAAFGSGKGEGPTPPEQVAQMNTQAYFDRMLTLMQQNPPAKADAPAVAKFAVLGIKPGELFTPPPQHRDPINAAIPGAKKRIAKGVDAIGVRRNGWQLTTKDIGTYGTNYDQRASVALGGLGANLPEDAVYPNAIVDSENQALSGKRRYLLHFSKDKLPPAKAFWSLTMYDDKGYLVDNELNRYALGDRDKLLYNPDGSLDIYIQRDPVSAEKKSNWLPAPDGPFALTMRLYSPRPEVLNGKWTPPAVRAVEPPAHPAAAR